MSYRRALVARWSHRDRLAVLVVAVAVAFLVGTTLLVLAAGGQAATMAAGFGTTEAVVHHESVPAARATASPDALVLPTAAVTVDGQRRLAVGVPGEAADRRYGPRDVRVGRPGTVGTIDGPTAWRLRGADGSVSVDLDPRGGGLLAPSWIALDAGTVAELGTTGAFVVEPTDRGSPLLGALPFVVLGTRGALRALAAVGVGAALLVAVTVHAVTRMAVRDRRRTIRVLRATGARPRTVLGAFALRAAGIAALGAAVGYAVGVVLTNVAVSLAVTLGVPTSLSVEVTPTAAAVFAVGLPAVVGLGAAAGGVAAWPAATSPPARIGRQGARAARWPGTALLDRAALVPTAASLTAFVTVVVLVAALAGAAAPATGSAATVTEPGSPHPLASAVPAGYADALDARGIDASPEILLLAVHDGEPFVARGADFRAFASVTGAEVVRGRVPSGPGEAAVGADLARTLDRGIGDHLSLGGSTRAAIDRVEIVGVFRADGYRDDQLVVPLATARHLAGVGPDRVHLVRADRLPPAGAAAAGGVLDLRAPSSVVAGGTIPVTVVLHNAGPTRATVRRRVTVDGRTRVVTATLEPGTRLTERVRFPAGEPGDRTVHAGALERTVSVQPRDAVSLRPLPNRAPPGSGLLVRVVGPSGRPTNATVVAGNRTAVTGADGRVMVRLGAPGEVTVTARRGAHHDATTITIARGATRYPTVAVGVEPANPGLVVRPTARVSLFNPWNRTLDPAVAVRGPATNATRSVALPPGERTTVAVRLGRAAPGEHRVTATVADRSATTTYTVRGDDRLASAVARAGHTGETGLSRAVAVAFGNLRVLVGALVALAALMSVGATTATFASAVHARRETLGIRRATGASPGRVVATVLGDALRLGSVAAVVGLLAGTALLVALARLGYLTAFGVRLSPVPSPRLAAAVLAGGLALVVVSATVATVALLAASPRDLLAGRLGPPAGGEADE